jgi:hypothetical protein
MRHYRILIVDDRDGTVGMVNEPRTDRAKQPPDHSPPAAAHHDHVGVLRPIDPRR